MVCSSSSVLAQSASNAAQVSEILSKAVTEKLLSPDWETPDEQFLALLAGQKATLLAQEVSVKGRPFFNSPLLASDAAREEIYSAIWLEALIAIVSRPLDVKLRASLGKLLLLQPAERAQALRTIPSTQLTPLLTQLQTSVNLVKNGMFTGDHQAFTAAYPALPVYLLSPEGRSPEREFAENQTLLPSIKASAALKDLLTLATLSDLAIQNPRAFAGTNQPTDRLKQVAILRAIQLLYASSVEHQPSVGLVGGPVQRAHELVALGVSDGNAINEAFIRSPNQIRGDLRRAQQLLFSRAEISPTRQVREIQTRLDGLSGLTSFINLYPKADPQGFIGDVVVSTGRKKFRNMFDFCGPNGALTQLLVELLRSTAEPSRTPSPVSSPVPRVQPGGFPIGSALGAGSELLTRKTAATTYEFRRPGAPKGAGVLTANVLPEGPIDILAVVGIAGLAGSDTALIRAVMLKYPGRQFRLRIKHNTPESREVINALSDNPTNPELRGIPFVAARDGKISIEVDGSSLTLLSTEGPATYWGDRQLLTRSSYGLQWLVDQGILPYPELRRDGL